MISVAELDSIAAARLGDAKALLAAGYAVEVSLKARVCRVLKWPDFPSTGGELFGFAGRR
jgi:hypothetical protein